MRWHPKIQAPGDTCQLMSWAEPSKQLSAQECRNLHIPKARTTTCDSRTTLLIISPCRCRLDFPGPLPPGTPGLMKQWLLISHSRTSMLLATCSLIRKHTSSESYSLCLWGPPSTSRAVVCGSWGGVLEEMPVLSWSLRSSQQEYIPRERNKPGLQEWVALGSRGGIKAESGHQLGVL